MKVLLDENLPHSLREYLHGHAAFTAAYMGWSGLKNGQLLSVAEAAGFEILVTGDRTLHQEQNLSGRKIAIVCLSAVNWPVIEPHVDKIARAIDRAAPGSFARVECGAFIRPRKRPEGPAHR